jgi:hypothetical protein
MKYVCKYCKKEFEETEKQKYCAHAGHCKRKALGIWKNPFKGKEGWSKGLTAKTDDRLKKLGRLASIRLQNKNDPFLIAGVKASRNRTEKSFKKQSETRKRLYKEGKLKPAAGIGRGKGSYLIYKGEKLYLRSTYEFIFVVYLLFKKIDFKYESVRVYYNGRNRFSDFEINGKLFEIKGRYKNKYRFDELKEAFVKNGHQIKIIFAETIETFKRYLERRNFKMSFYLDLIYQLAKKKQKFIFRDEDIELLKTTEYGGIKYSQLLKEIEQKQQKITELKMAQKIARLESKRNKKQPPSKKYKTEKKKFKEEKKKMILEERLRQFRLVDKTKFGWVGEVAKLWNTTCMSVRRFLKKNCPNELENAFTKKFVVISKNQMFFDIA